MAAETEAQIFDYLYDDLDKDKENDDDVSIRGVYEERISTLMGVNERLSAEIAAVKRNFEALLKTARNEIRRKDKRIADLQRQLDDVVFRRTPLNSRKDLESVWKRFRAPDESADSIFEKRLEKFLRGQVEDEKKAERDSNVVTLRFGNCAISHVVHGKCSEPKEAKADDKRQATSTPTERQKLSSFNEKVKDKRQSGSSSLKRQSETDDSRRMKSTSREAPKRRSPRKVSKNTSEESTKSPRSNSTRKRGRGAEAATRDDLKRKRLNSIDEPRTRNSSKDESKLNEAADRKRISFSGVVASKEESSSRRHSVSAGETTARDAPVHLDMNTSELTNLIRQKKETLKRLREEEKKCLRHVKPKEDVNSVEAIADILKASSPRPRRPPAQETSLVEELGLYLSDSSQDETSPVKKRKTLANVVKSFK